MRWTIFLEENKYSVEKTNCQWSFCNQTMCDNRIMRLFRRTCGMENVMKKVEKVNSIKVNLKLFFKFKLTNGRWLSDKQIGNELGRRVALKWCLFHMLTCPHLCIRNIAVYISHMRLKFMRSSFTTSAFNLRAKCNYRVVYCVCTIDKLSQWPVHIWACDWF